MVAGGAEVGAALVHHEDVDTVHITGSKDVHDAIVWGLPEVRGEQERRDPCLEERDHERAGCVTPGS